MPSLNITSYIYAALIAAIAVLGIWLMIDRARLSAAQGKLAAVQAQLDASIVTNHSLKAVSDECNSKVDALKKDGEEWKARAIDAETTAQPFFIIEDQSAKAIVAHPPAKGCVPVLKYYREQARAFRW